MPDAEQLRRLDALLEDVLELPLDERSKRVVRLCGDDVALCAQLERLVALAEGADHLLSAGGGLKGALWHGLPTEVAGGGGELRPGHRLGRYEIRGLLGVGGMGRVYQADDPTLGRAVAIKAIAGALPGEADGARRRFEREARLLATLNHPNVGAIYGLETIDGAPYLVLELVEGPTLAERLHDGPLPVADAVEVALQVALALEEAHGKGVVHRDLKPANVKLSPDGRVKVLDFGIAKALPRTGDASLPEDEAREVTQAGAVLGTAPYMSPEQVRGLAVDTRTDVWSFGCLLYEMLAGRPAFHGGSPAEAMAAVLRDEVDWSRLPSQTPASLQRLLRRCLRRELRERLQDIGDARLELAELREEDENGTKAGAHRGRRYPWLELAAALAVAGLAGAWIGQRSASAPSRPASRLSLELPAGLTLASDFAAPFAISPDGSRLVLVATEDGTTRLYLRGLDSLQVALLPGTEGAWQPFFSPDGGEVAFFADRKLKKVSLADGAVMSLADIGANPRGGTWAEDGTIVLAASPQDGLVRLDARGGALAPITRLDHGRGEGSHRWPAALPGGRWVLFTTGIHGATFDDARLEAVALDTGERRLLPGSGSFGRYASGRLLFARAGRLFATAFDIETATAQGAPELALEGLRWDVRNGGAHVAISASGTLVYGPGAPASTETHLAWVDTAGNVARISDTARQFREPALAPDGRRVAVRIGTEAESDIWLVDTETGTLSRLSVGLSPHRPTWTPDGRAVTVSAERDGRWRLLTLGVGGGEAVTVLEGPHRMYPAAWSPGGGSLLFQERRPDTGWDLRLVPVGQDQVAAGPARDLAATPFQEANAALSPDGRFVAYESDELDDINGIYLLPLAQPSARRRVMAAGARWPRWGPQGQLYSWRPAGARPQEAPLRGLHRIDWAEQDGKLEAARSSPVWGEAERTAPLLHRLVVGSFAGFDVERGRGLVRFLFLERDAAPAEDPLRMPVVSPNWTGELGSPPRDRR